jgi:gluconate 2-dehydrogenase gamma chain
MHDDEPILRISRRRFVGSTIGAAGIAGSLAALNGCEAEAKPPVGIVPGSSGPAAPYPDVPGPPPNKPVAGRLQWFTDTEATTLDALVATMLPGTPDDPGAREVGVVAYIDGRLATAPGGVATRHYGLGPFAKKVGDDEPLPEPTKDAVYVHESVLARHGPQSPLDDQERYRRGLAALDRFATSTAGAPFAELTDADREEVVDALATDAATGFDKPGAQEFFNAVRSDVVEGMFGDPAYGGNVDLAGWKLVGYPGAQRGYTVDDVQGRTPERPPQSMRQLPHFHPGMDGPNVVLPVSGSRGGLEVRSHEGR